jgi:hypothetical protein
LPWRLVFLEKPAILGQLFLILGFTDFLGPANLVIPFLEGSIPFLLIRRLIAVIALGSQIVLPEVHIDPAFDLHEKPLQLFEFAPILQFAVLEYDGGSHIEVDPVCSQAAVDAVPEGHKVLLYFLGVEHRALDSLQRAFEEFEEACSHAADQPAIS